MSISRQSIAKGVFIGLALQAAITVLLLEYRNRRGRSDQELYQKNISEPSTRQALSHPPDRRHIIILTYARSGSTFTSEIVAQDPRTFLIFEPLHSALIRYTDKDQLESFDVLGSDKFANKSDALTKGRSWKLHTILDSNITYANYSVEASHIVHSMLTCQFQLLRAGDLHSFLMGLRGSMQEFYKCFKTFPAHRDHFPHYLGCLWQLRELCLSREIAVTKVIRFPARLLPSLMKKLPQLQVIYLVRDPRGTLISERYKLNSYRTLKIEAAARSFCSMVSEDLRHIRFLSREHPHRVKALRYETLSMDPLRTTERLHKFLGLRFTPAVRDHVRNITAARGKATSRSVLSTVRDDSWAAANRWRTSVAFRSVLSVERACRAVYEELGFDEVRSERHLRDINVSLAARDSSMPYL